MNFVNLLLRGIGFIPSLVAGIEGMSGNKTGAEKKDAAMLFLQNALGISEAIASQRDRSAGTVSKWYFPNNRRRGDVHELLDLVEKRDPFTCRFDPARCIGPSRRLG